MDSKYITDVIVTTDSENVKLIAKQMGVKIKNRDKKLCGDSITLDSVIYDAIPKDEEWDYIITMQPTSPTLKVDTLDKAIKYTIENKLDTVISAINNPHLSWREENGKKVPNYKERLNRQYLPPYYMETGAFVISKYEVVTENTRIGNKMDIYELPKNESQDIDDFSDLQNVIRTLKEHKVAIYVNGNNKIGTGHVYRVLELADEFFCKPDILYDKNQTKKEIFGTTSYNLIPVNGVNELLKKCKENKYNIFINDILATTTEYMKQLRNSLPNDAKIINFEDDGEGQKEANAVFNALYETSEYENVYAGEKYYICPKSFLFFNPIEIKSKVKDILITFGGADPQNYTDRILKMITKRDYEDYNFTIILGKSKSKIETLLKYNEYENISVLYNVKNIAEIMHKTDIAITSRGRTSYELAMLGIPSITMAQNIREEKHEFANEENGFNYIGLNPNDEIIEENLKMYINLSKKTRLELQRKMIKHNLKNGRNRIINIINSL